MRKPVALHCRRVRYSLHTLFWYRHTHMTFPLPGQHLLSLVSWYPSSPLYPYRQFRRAGTRAIGLVPKTIGDKSLDDTEKSEDHSLIMIMMGRGLVSSLVLLIKSTNKLCFSLQNQLEGKEHPLKSSLMQRTRGCIFLHNDVEGGQCPPQFPGRHDLDISV